MGYSTQKNKLKKFWEDNNQNDVDLKRKAYKLHRLFNLNSKWKSVVTLYDSDWVTGTATVGTRTAKRGDSTPVLVPIATKALIEIPEFLLPFVNVEIQTKAVPEVNYKGIFCRSILCGKYFKKIYREKFIHIRFIF